MISAQQAASIRNAYVAYERAREKFDPKRFKRGGSYSPDELHQIEYMAGGEKPTNAELSKLEVYEFMTKPPQRLHAYYNDALTEVHTFMGERLGRIIWRGKERRPMGGLSQSVRVLGDNGKLYVGTCNLSSGTYCTLRLSTAKHSG